MGAAWRVRAPWLLAAVLVASACGSGDGDSSVTEPGPAATGVQATAGPATEPDGTAPPATEPSPSGSAIGPGSRLDEADRVAVTAVFEVFFGGAATTVDDKVAALEDGETYRGMLVAASENEQFQQMSVDVRSVDAGPDDRCAALGARPGCAVVTHDLLVAGLPMAAGIESAAVRSGDGWLVAASAWCAVVEIGGASCPEEAAGAGA